MKTSVSGVLQVSLVMAACGVLTAQQAPAPPAIAAWGAVKPIDPPATPLPSEEASANVTRFSFIGYGDTRSGATQPGVSGDGEVVHPEHSRIVDRMIATAKDAAGTPFPVRFVLQSGDAVLRGQDAKMWNVSFTPIIDRLTHANLPYFFAVGNHDTGTQPAGDPSRALGLHNTLTAISKLIPPEGSPRRLAGYPTYAFGYGNTFIIAFDSNIASDPLQFSWVADQLEHVDRGRYRNVIAFFHHPPYSSGPHSGASADPLPGTGRKAPDRVEPTAAAIRAMYMPLFRRHHVKLLVTGHDHLYDHFVERYETNGIGYRMDTIITGGGGAPLYGYIGEPDLRPYAAAAGDKVRIEHLMKPGESGEENPHHFVLFRVDGERISLEVISTRDTPPYAPYPGGRSKIALTDSGS